MSKFPEPVSLPEAIPKARKNRKKQVIGAAKWGIFIRLSVIGFELFGFYWFASSSLLMDAIASSLDIASSIVLIIFIRLASRPPDEDHPFGHGRYEPLAGLQLGSLLILIGAGMMIQQITRVFELPQGIELNSKAWIIPLLATLMLELCYQFVLRVSKKQLSPALAAEALHYRIDALTSLFAALTLIFAAIFPSVSVLIDHLGAITISLLMVLLGVSATRSNLDQLMDKAPSPDLFEKVRRAALRVEGVLDTEKIRIQVYGPDAHVDIDVEVDPQLPVEVAHRISQKVRTEIQKEWPSVQDATVHIEPFYPNDHVNTK